ncbi:MULTISPECIES: M23 family metallopeptidase [unclassified Pseudodesulfovibrio]|uniref:M23 family metallopeptidase n=1 Tax=unclassified Pseudodesulfovibrio TaxID=2661612 RepID=UPI000FEB9DB5|nr:MULTISPECIES: M23 family metallopeptidase [unclassified Pseudodesulfovibrio]MCJ2163647.1 M23 family metallopeptidase [Pseudodesulfovibrio sp. S3-i]RWU06090.1 M23 family peptidase [Pseudodesulfovibrio sp. S3]
MNKDTTGLTKKKSSKGLPIGLFSIIIILALCAGLFMLFKDTTPPIITITPEVALVGKEIPVVVRSEDPGSGLKLLEITAVQGDTRTPLAVKTYPGGIMQAEETILLSKGLIKEGEFTIEVTAQDASIYPFGAAGVSTASKSYNLDMTPPRIFVQSHTNNLNQGGAGLMVYALSEEASETGIRVGERFFPAYLQPGNSGKFLYYCMFTHPWDTNVNDFKPFITAMDGAGNSAKQSFNYHTNGRSFRHDQINLSDNFMEQTIPEFQGLVPNEGTPLDQYLYINNELRKQNRAKLVELSRLTSPTMLWTGTFARLPNAANRARFADARDYMYKGKKVDFQTHLGLDLASLKHAPVPAGNDGRIVYADFLGIYGNVVVIDHGLGLQSLYAHLSSIAVALDDMVAKGQTIGNTGTTGLAGGDHLHYGITVAGIPTQPIEWWDSSWITNNITSKME